MKTIKRAVSPTIQVLNSLKFPFFLLLAVVASIFAARAFATDQNVVAKRPYPKNYPGFPFACMKADRPKESESSGNVVHNFPSSYLKYTDCGLEIGVLDEAQSETRALLPPPPRGLQYFEFPEIPAIEPLKSNDIGGNSIPKTDDIGGGQPLPPHFKP